MTQLLPIIPRFYRLGRLPASTLGVLLLLAVSLVGMPQAHAQDRGDVHEDGTTVNGDPIDMGDSAPGDKALTSAGRLNTAVSQSITPGVGGAAITGINTRINLFEENCLFTFAQVNVVDANGDAILGLTEADFDVQEDAGFGFAPPQDQFVIPPQATTTRKADIVFAVDNSGSMGNEIAAINSNLASFVSALQGSGIDAQLGLVRYGQGGGGTFNTRRGSPIITNGGALVADPIVFRDNIFSQNTINGATEPMYAAVVQGLQNFNFRPDAQTIIIGVTDESFNQGINTEADALNELLSNNATFFGLVPVSTFGTGFIEQQALNLATPTGGSVFNITSNFNTILNSIAAQVAGTYIVGYIPDEPFAGPPASRSVEITVNNTGIGSFTATGAYTPGARPAVRRSAATEAILTATAGQALTLQAETADLLPPGITTATLFYRTTGTTTYQPIPLTDVGGGIFEATVPASAVQAPGLDFYFSVNDGTAAATAPGSDPQATPFQIGVTNSAPEIVHTPPASFSAGSSVPVTATVTDDGTLTGVGLFYRQQGRLEFTPVAMTSSGSTFSATIPGSDVTSFGLDYYVAATDDDGITRTFGTPDLPVVLGGCVPLADGTPPVCEAVTVSFNATLGVYELDTGASDPESGIASVEWTTLDNMRGFVDANGPFDQGDVFNVPGTPESIALKGVQIDPTQGGAVFAEVANGAGLISECDPVVKQLSSSVPERTTLLGNYPNPAVGSTTIEVRVAEPGPVRLEVYDLLGRKVSTLLNREMTPGTYQVEWTRSETAQLASGTYIYRLEAGSVSESRRLTLLR